MQRGSRRALVGPLLGDQAPHTGEAGSSAQHPAQILTTRQGETRCPQCWTSSRVTPPFPSPPPSAEWVSAMHQIHAAGLPRPPTGAAG